MMATAVTLLRTLAVITLSLALHACGGGGGGGSDTPTAIPPVSDGGGSGGGGNDGGSNDGGDGDSDPPPDRDIFDASRFASRTTFGLDLAGLEEVRAMGEEAWLEQQFALPVTSHDAVVADLLQRQATGEFDDAIERQGADDFTPVFGRMAWWHNTVTAPDQLRQRVAYALSQIFVISDEVNNLFIPAYGTSNFYDMLLNNAFGNFRDLLRDVTLHPSMGVYLSHMNNARSDPDAGTFPDENYAREVMQLFSIGLFELNSDGSEIVDAEGQPIPTYDNDDIREFAKIFTGLSWGGSNRTFGGNRFFSYQDPMQMFDDFHEPGEKRLLNGTVVPAGQSGMEDIEAAVDNLFNHPNVPPFIGKQLIQRLITSNPSPAYVDRVSTAFIDNGAGVRGDMEAVLRAILFDPEAMADPDPAASFGKLREPVVRYTAMLRQLGVNSPDGFYANLGYFVQASVRQHPLSSPSVFNFYLPSHMPIGPIGEQNLVAPEFQITDTNSVVQISNLMQFAVVGDFVNDISDAPFFEATLTFDDYTPLASDPDALLELLDTVFTYGTLSDDTRLAIRDLISLIDDLDVRVRVAAYLLLISPDYAVEI